MMTCTAKELCAATGGTLVQDGEGFSCVSTDSRRVEQGCLFIPLVGERFDGHTYLAQALESGAAGCLCSRLPEALVPGKFYVQVEDTLRALGQLAGWYREKFPIPVVQITGSAGKTTTKEMIASVLSRHFLTLKTEANYNNEIGTPGAAGTGDGGLERPGRVLQGGPPLPDPLSGGDGASHGGGHHQYRGCPH